MSKDCSLDDVAEALKWLDCADRDTWVMAAMAIRAEFGEGGFDTWDDWGSGYKKYKESQALSVWKSCTGRGIGIGSLFDAAMKAGWVPEKREYSEEEKAAFAKECADRRAKREIEIAQEEADAQRWYGVVAQTSNILLPQLKTVGNSPYLGKKRVGAFGVLFAPHSFVIQTNDNFTVDILAGAEATKDFFDKQKLKSKEEKERDSFNYFKRGSILVPLRDMQGALQNFQIIFNDGTSKRFFTHGRKSGLFHVIGIITADSPVIFCEGYATGASLHMATGWPVVVCFDAGNMPVVAELFRHLTNAKIFAGDNDWETALDPKKKNTGLVKCQEAAKVGLGTWCVPEFIGDAAGQSDFNDLHVAAGLDKVKEQLKAAALNAGNGYENKAAIAVSDLNQSPDYGDVPPPDYGDIPIPDYEDFALSSETPAIAENQPPKERQPLKGEKSVFSIEILLKRFNFVIQDASVWDAETETQIKKSAFNELVGKPLADEWRAHLERLDINQADIQAVKNKRARERREALYTEDDRWRFKFILNDNGEIKADIGNAKLVLENDARWRDVLGYCDFSYRVLKRTLPPFPNSSVGEWTDADTDRLRIWLAENYRFTPKTADALGAVVVVAEANRFHPVREYLTGLTWDKVPRLERWLHSYMGAEANAYSALAGKMFLIGAVARVMRPPVKMDTVLIFEGLQGLGKSTALKILGGEWFTDTPLVLGDKDGFQQMQGVWIIELAELDSFNKADHTRAKQFFGSQVDRYRPSYGRLTQTFARQCVFAGSTNQDSYLRDATGNRRYWPVACSCVLAKELEADRDQLWAEAFHRYVEGEAWWPADDHKLLFEEQQEKRFDADVWEELISTWLMSTTKNRVLMSDIMGEALNLEAAQMKPPEQKRVGQIMAHLGWVRVRPRVAGGGRETGYERPESWKVAA